MTIIFCSEVIFHNSCPLALHKAQNYNFNKQTTCSKLVITILSSDSKTKIRKTRNPHSTFKQQILNRQIETHTKIYYNCKQSSSNSMMMNRYIDYIGCTYLPNTSLAKLQFWNECVPKKNSERYSFASIYHIWFQLERVELVLLQVKQLIRQIACSTST